MYKFVVLVSTNVILTFNEKCVYFQWFEETVETTVVESKDGTKTTTKTTTKQLPGPPGKGVYGSTGLEWWVQWCKYSCV